MDPLLLPKAEKDLKRGISLGVISIGMSEWMRLHAFDIALSSARAQDGCTTSIRVILVIPLC